MANNTDWEKELYGSKGYASQTNQSNGQKLPWLNNAMQLGGNLVGGQIGSKVGAGLGALVPGLDFTGIPEAAGAYGGRIVGGGVGAGAGNYGADFIRQNLLGDKTVNPNATIPNSIQAGQVGAVSEGVGVPLAKGLGFLAHPIAPFISRVNNILAKSPKEIDFGAVNGLLQDFRDNILPNFSAKGQGIEANPAFNNVSARVNEMIDALQPHVSPTVNNIGKQDIGDMKVPIAVANQVKRNLYDLVRKNGGVFGEMGNTEGEVTKAFARSVKDTIHGEEPGTKFPDAIASALFKAPDFLEGLSNIIPNAKGASAVRQLGRFPVSIVQKIIPRGGGALNQLIPGLIQGGAVGLNGLQ